MEPPSPPRVIRDRVLRQVERFHARSGPLNGTFRPNGVGGDALLLLDQRVLPVLEVDAAVRRSLVRGGRDRTMVVRGAPAIGVSAAFGLVLAVRVAWKKGRPWRKAFDEAATELAGTRPTAVNLFWRSTGCAGRPRC